MILYSISDAFRLPAPLKDVPFGQRLQRGMEVLEGKKFLLSTACWLVVGMSANTAKLAGGIMEKPY